MARNYTKGYVVKDHGKWRAIVNWQGEDGKQHRMTKTTGIRCSPNPKDNRNKSHAEAFLREWRDGLVRDEAQRDSDVYATGSDTPLAEYCKNYLSLHHVNASTMSGYMAACRKMVGTPMGDKPMGEVTADDVRQWETSLRKDGLSVTTIAHYHAFLAQVMKGAAAEGKIIRNPMALTRAPRRRPKPVNSITPELRAEMLRRMDSLEDQSLANAVRIALLTCRARSSGRIGSYRLRKTFRTSDHSARATFHMQSQPAVQHQFPRIHSRKMRAVR